LGELKATDTRLLDFPVDYVYRTVTDFASYSKWWPHEIRFDIEHLNPAVVGTTINIQNGSFVRWKSKITSFRVNRLLAIDYVDGAWLGKTQYRFAEKDGKTELTLEIDLDVNRFWLKFFSVFLNYSRIHSRQIRHVFNNLEKYLAEHEGSYIHAIRLSHIDHIVLTVKNIEESCLFYHKALGMEIINLGDSGKALRFGNQKITLYEAGKEFRPNASNPAPGSVNVCFISHTSINQVVLELKQKNIEIVEGPVEKTGTHGKLMSVYIRDPDGNLIEISNYEK
jgi:catechol 2,3-dioxygenase-like lactoylglutathione lyase family enzyme